MSSLEAQRLAEQTGALFSESKAILESITEFSSAKETLLAVLVHRRKLYESDVLKLAWQPFAPISEKEFGIDETIKFIESLGLELENPLVLAVAYELQAPETGKFKQQEFVDGFARNEARSLAEFRNKVVPELQLKFATIDYFRYVYRYSYFFLTDNRQAMKTLDYETARSYWQLLLLPRFGRIIESWLSFTAQMSSRVNLDTWNMLLEFCIYANSDPNLDKYDESSAWPTTFDEFVDDLKVHHRINGNSVFAEHTEK